MLKDKIILCDACGMHIKPKDAYRYEARSLCVQCCMEARMPRTRKTHWQYLSSIKTDYLQPPKTKCEPLSAYRRSHAKTADRPEDA
ncbi:MAG: hypothetical protein GY697_17290 [Desulfobacterales bacterium]|nr:hypothetical protein [Desulfobacterales bacterium]